MDRTFIARRLAETIGTAAPKNAVSAEWVQTIEMAAVSSGRGGFSDRDGHYLPSSEEDKLFDAVREAVEEIYAVEDESWNVARISWRPGEAVAIETSFDLDIVPRGADDPIYEQAATARRSFWNSLGAVSEGALGESTEPNVHGQTRWLSPHRRLLHVTMRGSRLLVTDGLSTPWAGVPEKENGSGLELLLELPNIHASVDPWVDSMLRLGDAISDEFDIASQVVSHGAILFFELAPTVAPYSHMILSIPEDEELNSIPSLPFGAAKLLKATAVTPDDLAGHSLDGWAVDAARQALARRREAKSK